MTAPGSTFGPYVLERRLGAGGMAETFVALRRGPAGFEQRVCLKRVLPALNSDPAFTEQFVAEAKIAAMLRHTNVVGLIDFGEHEGSYYLALELVEGVDLRCLLRRMVGAVPVEFAVIVAHDLARALAFAHAARDGRPAIVHRDVSPANLLVSTDGDVKLADFGIAKAIQTARTTASDVIKGKVQYMAPEQMLGERIDGRADLFSLGVVLFEMLGGRRPFDGASDVDTMRRVIDGVRPSLFEVAPRAPRALAQLTEQLLAHKAADRPSASEVLDRLGSISARARRRLASEVVAARSTQPTALLNLSGPTVPLAARELEAAELGSRADPRASTAPRSETWTEVPALAARGKRSKKPFIALGLSLTLGAAVLGYAVLVGPRRQAVSAAPPAAEPASNAAHAAHSLADRPASSERPDQPAAAEATRPSFPAAASLTAPATVSETARAAESARDDSALPDAGASTASAPEARQTDETHATRRPRTRRVNDSSRAGHGTTRSTVRVVVVPWGEVWVDGRYMGRAPIDVVVAPGEHRIEAGQGSRRQTQRLSLAAGDTRVVELEFE